MAEAARDLVLILSVPLPLPVLAQDMKLPKPLLDHLKAKKILAPTPIQLQGLPVACVSLCSPLRLRVRLLTLFSLVVSLVAT